MPSNPAVYPVGELILGDTDSTKYLEPLVYVNTTRNLYWQFIIDK
jgi:hypothetical protein